MVARLTNKNEKVLQSASFPKVSLLKQFNKKTQKDFEQLLKDRGIIGKDHKNLKGMLVRKELIVTDDCVLINIGGCVRDGKLYKAGIIQLVRAACVFSNNISVYGWNALMLGLDIQYGSKKCLDLVKEIRSFIIAHGNAFLEVTERPGFLSIVKATESALKERSDYLICKYPKEETSCYLGMWALSNGTYYVYDKFHEALLNYGYTKEQIRGVIHRCSQTGTNETIPLYLRKRYLVNPNATNDLKKVWLDVKQ